MTKLCSFASILALALALAACGGGAGAGPVDQSTAEDGCQAVCDRDVECGSTDADCVADCVDDVVGVFREDVFEDATACIAALECGASDDACLSDSCAPTGAHETYEARCRDELGACGLTGADLDEVCEVTPTDDGDLGFLCVLATPIMEDLTACFDEPSCQEIADCQQAVIDALGA